jgi:hypothetical protein
VPAAATNAGSASAADSERAKTSGDVRSGTPERRGIGNLGGDAIAGMLVDAATARDVQPEPAPVLATARR